MTTYYGVSAPLGSGKTTAAIEFAGYSAQAGEKIAIAQPSIRLINQSLAQFRDRWPNLPVGAIHSDNCQKVGAEISAHTRASSGGEVLFLTHSTLMQSPYWDRQKEWRLIIDEAPAVVFHAELSLTDHHHILLPALETEPYNIRYSRLIPGNIALLEKMADNESKDMVSALFQELTRKMASHRWDMFVLTEQWERFHTGQISDGRLLVFGLADPMIFTGFSEVIMMSANLEQTLAYQHLVQHGHVLHPHSHITKGLRYQQHDNGRLLMIHYAVEEAGWSKHKRDNRLQVGSETFSVNDLIMVGAMEVFGDQPFVQLFNKDFDHIQPLGANAINLPHSPHGLNCFQHIHNALVLAALNPTPAFYTFLDEVAHLNSQEVRRAIYHEAAYQAAGRISLRNPEDFTPKHLVVADRGAAEAIANLYLGAKIVRLPFSDVIPEKGKPGPKRIHSTDAARKKAHRDGHKIELRRQLDHVNGRSSETNCPIDYKDNSSLTSAEFGGSVFSSIYAKNPETRLCGLAVSDFIEFLRNLHTRSVAKENAWLWSPAEFESKAGVETGRGLENITAVHGVFLDNDGGDITPVEFAAMLPHLIMVIHNSASSTPNRVKWRAIIPTTCAMTIDVHREIMLQIRQALNRRGYYDKKQLAKRAEKNLGGKCHGFDPSKYNAASMFYLPAQAAAGPHASFFLVFDGGKRRAIDPYQWIDKTIINHQPEPEPPPQPAAVTSQPVSHIRKDPKLTRALLAMEAEKQARQKVNYQDRADAAVERWRQHPKATGNEEFFLLAVALAGAGMDRVEAERTLHTEAGFSHGAESQRQRRQAIPAIMKKLEWTTS
jgi:hypothetical protein